MVAWSGWLRVLSRSSLGRRDLGSWKHADRSPGHPWSGSITLVILALLSIGFSKKATAYSVYSAFGCVLVFDTESDAEIANICDSPNYIGPWIVMSPDGKYLYATGFDADYGSSQTTSKIFVIDTTSNKVTKKINFPLVNQWEQIILTQDGKYLYVPLDDRASGTSRTTTKYSIIDTSTNTIVNSLTLPFPTNYLTFTKDGSRAYAINGSDPKKISVIDTNSQAVISTFSLTWQVSNATDQTEDYVLRMNDMFDVWGQYMTTQSILSLTPDGSRIYVYGQPIRTSATDYSDINDNTIVIAFDTTTNNITSRISRDRKNWINQGWWPTFRFSQDGQHGYMNGNYQSIALDILNNTLSTNLGLGKNLDIAITPDGKYGYSAAWSDGFYKFDTATNTIINYDVIPWVGYPGFSLVIGPDAPPQDPPTLIDPVRLDSYPSLLRYNSLNRLAISPDPAVLASGGRVVENIAADGVAQVVVSIPASAVGEKITVKLSPSQCTDTASASCIDNYGLIFDPAANPPPDVFGATSSNIVTVTAFPTPQGPTAFAAYRAPMDFVRTDSSTHTNNDSTAPNRSVTLSLTSDQKGNLPDLQINVVRPPIVLVHGNWSNKRSWKAFQPFYRNLDKRFKSYLVDYSSTMALGVAQNALGVATRLESTNEAFRRQFKAATSQFDVVAYSLGGLVTRMISSNAKAAPPYFAYGKHQFHKMITLDTPHLGSPFASNLWKSNPACKYVFESKGNPVGENIRDMMPNSFLLKWLARKTKSGSQHIPTHAIVGSASDDQRIAAENAYFSNSGSSQAFDILCPNLLPVTGFNGLLGTNSDLIVSEQSQMADGLGINGANIAFSSTPVPVIHTIHPLLFPIGPDVLARELINGKIGPVPNPQTVITQHVIDLLNEPVTVAYDPIRP
jgi:pimeloyl-ACP methyl ester carboxylesterase